MFLLILKRIYIASLEQVNTRQVYSDLCICLHLFC